MNDYFLVTLIFIVVQIVATFLVIFLGKKGENGYELPSP